MQPVKKQNLPIILKLLQSCVFYGEIIFPLGRTRTFWVVFNREIYYAEVTILLEAACLNVTRGLTGKASRTYFLALGCGLIRPHREYSKISMQ